ncbi:hypothetical protein K501DRAFT_282633 [Backusella circina FSU 941]|nr:hypothetical protein K501DRAFT_282633 [Backusella circina FSU 941]
MTEGTIHQWKLKEGDSFSAGDVLLELETDKAQIDVEAPEDGILAKIVLQDGGKGAVNSLIALLAEEGDDISNVQVPEDDGSAAAAPEKKEEEAAPKQPTTPQPVASPISHHDVDTSKLKKPLSPAVLNLALKYGIKDIGSIKPSGHGGRLLKGDVLAHLGLITPKPAPKPTFTVAPPRDQIVFAKKAVEKKEKKEPLPTFISKQITVDSLFGLRQSLNDQHGTRVSVNDFIAKAAERALQDVVTGTASNSGKTVVHGTSLSSFSSKYTGGEFKVFHLNEPTYDFITDSYQTSKPYKLSVSAPKTPKQTSSSDMLDLIGYLGGEKPKVESRRINLTTKDTRLDFSNQPKNNNKYTVEVKLDGGVPGAILNNAKANTFLDRVDYYIRNPSELVA